MKEPHRNTIPQIPTREPKIVIMRNYSIFFNTLSEEFRKAKILFGNTARIPFFHNALTLNNIRNTRKKKPRNQEVKAWFSGHKSLDIMK